MGSLALPPLSRSFHGAYTCARRASSAFPSHACRLNRCFSTYSEVFLYQQAIYLAPHHSHRPRCPFPRPLSLERARSNLVVLKYYKTSNFSGTKVPQHLKLVVLQYSKTCISPNSLARSLSPVTSPATSCHRPAARRDHPPTHSPPSAPLAQAEQSPSQKLEGSFMSSQTPSKGTVWWKAASCACPGKKK